MTDYNDTDALISSTEYIETADDHFSADGLLDSELSNEPYVRQKWQRPPIHTLYKRRWYILFLFSLVCFTQGAIWNTWGPLADSAKVAWDWSDSTIALLTNWGCITYMVGMPFFAYLMDAKGLRWAVVLTIFLVTFGAGLRCFTFTSSAVTVLVHLGQMLNGFGGPVAMSAPPVISAAWFPENQRTTATAVGSAAGGFGVASGFILGPLLVYNTTLSPNNSSISSNTSSSNNSTYEVSHTRDLIKRYMYIEFGWSVLLLLAVLIYFPSKPPKPPSISASIPRVNFKDGILKLLRHQNFWILGLTYAMSNGIFQVWSSVIDVNLQPIGVSQDDAGWLGFYGTIAGQITALFISVVSDFVSRKMKLFLLSMYGVGSAAFVIFSLICIQVIPYNIAGLYVTMVVGSMALEGSPPLFFELVCESTYPIAESATNGFITWLNNLFGLIFLSILMIPNIGTRWMNWVMCGAVITCIPAFLVYKENYGRLDVDTQTSGIATNTSVRLPDAANSSDNGYMQTGGYAHKTSVQVSDTPNSSDNDDTS